MQEQAGKGKLMHKSLLPPALLLPFCGCCLLAIGTFCRPPLVSTTADNSEMNQRKPAFANPNRRIILWRQYRFYQHCRHQPGLGEEAAAGYNQCVADSDPSALLGTTLPHHLP